MDLLRRVEVRRAGDDETVKTVLAEHLRTVADQAGDCKSLSIVVPPSWGPRHFELVRQAGQAAALPPPQIVSEPAAIAAAVFADAAVDDTCLVCVLGQRTSHATVVQRGDSGWIRVATQKIPDATGDRLDHALAAAVSAADVDGEDLVGQIAAIRPRLCAGHPAAIIIAGHPSPITVTPQAFASAVQAVRDTAVVTVLDVLDAAAVDAQQLHGVAVAGDLAATLDLVDDLSTRLQRPVLAAPQGRLTGVYGALALHTMSARPDSRPGLRRWGFRGTQLVGPVVAFIAATLLQWQIFDIVSFMLGPDIRRLPSDYQILAVAFDTAAFACAGWCVCAAVLSVGGSLVPAIQAAGVRSGENADRQAGQMYAFAALTGFALAGAQGLLAQAVIGGPPDLAPPYLWAAVAGTVIPFLVAITVGLTSRWLTAQPPWTDRVRYPLTAVILAVAGILAANARSTGLPIRGLPDIVTSVLTVCGGGLLGAGIAFTLVALRSARIILGIVLGVAGMVVVGLGTLHSVTVIYLICVALWWLRRAARIAADNLPSRWSRRLAVTHISDPPQ